MYLYIDSSAQYGNISRAWNDFVVNLPASYYFSRNEEYEIGMVYFYIKVQKSQLTAIGKSHKQISEPIKVICNLAETSVVNSGEENILGIIRLHDVVSQIYTPAHISYVPLSIERLSSVHVYLRQDNGSLPSVNNATTTVVLHIKKRGF